MVCVMLYHLGTVAAFWAAAAGLMTFVVVGKLAPNILALSSQSSSVFICCMQGDELLYLHGRPPKIV